MTVKEFDYGKVKHTEHRGFVLATLKVDGEKVYYLPEILDNQSKENVAILREAVQPFDGIYTEANEADIWVTEEVLDAVLDAELEFVN